MNVPANFFVNKMNETLSDYYKVHGNSKPKVLLHACCAPCSSYCLLCIRDHADVGVYFYNPNITVKDEYEHRLEELKRLVGIYNDDPDRKLPLDCCQTEIEKALIRNLAETESVDIKYHYVNSNKIEMIEAPYESDVYLSKIKGLEKCPERGERCKVCFDLRLRQTALKARELGYDFFATTLTLSPLKDAFLINQIGERIAKEVDIKYLPTDFKKKNGYKMSIELSKEFGLYRQNYCGCVYSKNKEEFT